MRKIYPNDFQKGKNNRNCKYPAFQENKEQIFARAKIEYDAGASTQEIYETLTRKDVIPPSTPYEHFKSRFYEWNKIKQDTINEEIAGGDWADLEITRCAKANLKLDIKRKVVAKQRNEVLKLENVSGFRQLIREDLERWSADGKIESPIFTTRHIKTNKTMPTYILSDIHYRGAIDNPSLKVMCERLMSDVKANNYVEINVISLGDDIEGLLHKNSIANNDGAIMSAIAFCNYMGKFYNELSKLCNINIWFISAANHTQTRTLGTERNELAREDLGYVIANTFEIMFSNNKRISFVYDSELCFNLDGKNIYALHGHQGYTKTPKSIENWVNSNGHPIDYICIGHYHKFRIDEFGHEKTIIQAPAIKGFISDYEQIAGYHLNPSFLKITDWNNFSIQQIRLEDAK